jgi:Tol biopolymer transport system component
MLIYLQDNGRERTFEINEPMTVEQFLAQEAVNVSFDDNDRLNPPPFTQLTDGMRITVVDIDEETVCETEQIPYEQETALNEGLEPGEERISQAGQNGLQEICYRIVRENGIQTSRTQVGQPQVIEEPVNEIRVVGVERDVEPVSFTGTLAYINNGNAWVMRGNSTTKQNLTSEARLDSLVFDLSPDGRYLMYTREPDDPDAFVNELWLIETNGSTPPVQLPPTDVLIGQWIQQRENIIGYSTGQVRPDIFPFWQAYNNLWEMEIDPQTGTSLNVRRILPDSGGGRDGWWGTVFKWSPDGEQIAWSRADSVGIVDENGELQPLMTYAHLRTLQNWSWRTSLSWSWDSQRLVATVHGPPLGTEPRDASPVFDIAVTDLEDSFEAQVVGSVGVWASPAFSPPLSQPESEFQDGYLAYLQARRPYNSVSSEYDLVVADRDGSNAQVIFPPEGQTGIVSNDRGLTPQDFVWSPDGQYIALIYQGNLWIVNVQSGVSHQLTLDGGASHPVWSP